jgi:hypothetical protein
VPGEPGKVRLSRLFHHLAGSVNGPRKQGVVVGIDGRQAPAGKHGGDGSLPGPGTACDLDSAHRYLSSASSDGGRKRVCDPARMHGRASRSRAPAGRPAPDSCQLDAGTADGADVERPPRAEHPSPCCDKVLRGFKSAASACRA